MEYIALIVIFSFYIVLVINFNSRSPQGERELKLMCKSRWKNKKSFTHYSKCAIMCTVNWKLAEGNQELFAIEPLK